MSWFTAIAFMLLMVGLNIYTEFLQPYDSTDNARKHQRSGMGLKIDHETGCHYLTSPFSSPTPRLGADGKHICRGEDK